MCLCDAASRHTLSPLDVSGLPPLTISFCLAASHHPRPDICVTSPLFATKRLCHRASHHSSADSCMTGLRRCMSASVKGRHTLCQLKAALLGLPPFLLQSRDSVDSCQMCAWACRPYQAHRASGTSHQSSPDGCATALC